MSARPYLIEAKRIAQLPGFNSAVLGMAADMRDYYRDNPIAARIFADVGQLAIVSSLLSAPAPMTEAELCRIVGAGALASRQRVRRHIAKLEHLNLLRRAEELADARTRPLAPSPELERQLGLWVIALAGRSVGLLELDPALLNQPRLAYIYLSQIMQSHGRGFSAFEATPTIARIVTLSRGHALVLELLATQIESGGASITFSRRAFASTFGVSRTHAIDLLDECAKSGLLTLEDTSRVRLTPSFMAEAQLWAAINFALAAATLEQRLIASLG